MAALYYTVAAVVLYVLSDWLLQRIEIARGERLQFRSVYFFAILLVLTLGVFALIRHLTT